MMYKYDIKEEVDEPEDIKMHTERPTFGYSSLHYGKSNGKNITDINSLLFEGSCAREDDKQAAVKLNDFVNERNCKHEHTRYIEERTEVIGDSEIVKMEMEVPEDAKVGKEHRLSYACLKNQETKDKHCIFVCGRPSNKINCGSEDIKQLIDRKKYDTAVEMYNQDIHSKVEKERPELSDTRLEIGRIKDMENKLTSDNSSRANCGSKDKKRVNAGVKVDYDDERRKCDAIESSIICHNNSEKEVINPGIGIYIPNKTINSKDAMKICDGEVTMKCVSGTEKQNIDPFAIEVDCGLKINEKLHLERHLELKHDSTVEWYKCQHCDFETKKKQDLNRHFRQKHDDTAEWHKCQHCEFETNSKHNLRRHFKQKHDDSTVWYKCEHCKLQTKSKHYLNKHFHLKHDDTAEYYKCQHCEFETKTKNYLKKHFRLKHDDSAEWYKCQHCRFETKKKSNLTKHVRLKHDDSAEWYKCEHCEFKNKDKYQLKRHFKFQHDSSAEWYKCEHCELETKYKYQLKRHSKLQHDGIVIVDLKQHFSLRHDDSAE